MRPSYTGPYTLPGQHIPSLQLKSVTLIYPKSKRLCDSQQCDSHGCSSSATAMRQARSSLENVVSPLPNRLSKSWLALATLTIFGTIFRTEASNSWKNPGFVDSYKATNSESFILFLAPAGLWNFLSTRYLTPCFFANPVHCGFD